MTDERCENCRFWKRGYRTHTQTGQIWRTHIDFGDKGELATGDCRAHSPVFFKQDNSNWPLSHETDWCGEYQPAKSSPGGDRVVASSSSPGGTEAELLKALTYLSDEILVTLPLAESFFRQVWGDTNFDIVMMRAHEAHDLIAKLTEPHHD